MRLIRLRMWAAEHMRLGEAHTTLLWAGIVGFLAGISSILFRRTLAGVQFFFTRHWGDIAIVAGDLEPWKRLVIPTLGGLVAGIAVTMGRRLTRGQDSVDYLEAVALGNGEIRSRPTIVKITASLFTIASGASIGREGPMVQISAWLASLAARRARFAVPRRRLLVACGAAAGIASAYNAPIAGALFVAEIVIGTIAMESFGPLIFSSVIATLTVRHLHGNKPVYEIPAFEMVATAEVIPYLILGLICGVVGVGFLRLLRGSAGLFHRRALPPAISLGLGGMVVGTLSLIRPDIWGNGFSVVDSILHTQWLWSSLVMVILCKVVATSASFGSGAPGGVFTPTLFLGAAVGALYGGFLEHLFPGSTAGPHAYSVVGMGCMLAATTQAPLMAILMLFELTLDYYIILPLMLGCVAAYQLASSLEEKAIYDHGQQRHTQAWPGMPLDELRVGHLVRPDPPTVRRHDRFEEVVRIFLMNRYNHLYVLDERGVFCGAIALHDIKNYLRHTDLHHIVTASDLLKPEFPVITEDARAAAALQAFTQVSTDRLPVVASTDNPVLVGSITKNDLLLNLANWGHLPSPQ